MPRIAVLTTRTADETIWPSEMLNVDPATLLVREESMELGEIAGVVHAGTGRTPAALSHGSGYHFRSREVNTPFISSLLVMFRLISPFGTIQTVANIPIGLQEMVLAVWLIVKGFNPNAIASGAGKVDMM